MAELRECAHCKGEAELQDFRGMMSEYAPSDKGDHVYIQCVKCGSCIAGKTMKAAITAWNTRAYDAEMEGLRGNLEAMTDMYRAAERELSQVKTENQMLRGMIDNSLRWEDMANDCT